MADALATLFEDACPRAREIDIATANWHVDLDDAPALRVVVPVGGGAWAHTVTGTAAVADGAVVLATGRAALRLTGDGGTPPDHLLVGSYDVTGSVCDRVLTGLPELVVGAAPPALLALLDHRGAGRDAVVVRVLDLLAVTVIRDWMLAHPDVSPAWASAHHDPVVGRALDLIHDRPDAPWTTETLARTVGSSRSALSRRFQAVLGESPMSYLTCWRLCLAADLLRKTDYPLAAVAGRVGYASPYAFSAAFQRFYGVRPGAHRRAAHV